MKQLPVVNEFKDGSKLWEHAYDKFHVTVYIPVHKKELYSHIVNYGFISPFLIVFSEKLLNMEEVKQSSEDSGLAKIASESAGSVVYIYPTNEGGWENAPDDIFPTLISESRISQYYCDGTAVMRDRFTKEWGEVYIRGAVLRTYLYGKGKAADYIAKNCLKTIEGEGLYGKGDITPVVCVLENLSVIPVVQRRDIPIISIKNASDINDTLKESVDYLRIEDTKDCVADYHEFVGTFKRMMGNLSREIDHNKLGMIVEPGSCWVTTTEDNMGDDIGTTEHEIGYVAFYNKTIQEKGMTVPMVMCFHGGGDSAMCMNSVSGWSRVAADNDFILVCVEHHMNSTASEMIEMIEQLKMKYPVDSQKLYATGFSMGGCKSWDLFQEYPSYFAGVAPMDATFEVGCNVFANKVRTINETTIVPVFYVGGEQTPLPELPFQAEKCVERMRYTLKVNQAKNPYHITSQA